MDYLKVSSKSSPASVAGAIAGMVKDGVPVNIQSVGAGLSTRRSRPWPSLAASSFPRGRHPCAPTFSDIDIDGQSRTAIRIAVYVHRLAPSDATTIEQGAGKVAI